MDNAGSENCGGYSRTCEKLRREFVNYSVIGDKGDIPATLKVEYFSNCPSLHRGICRRDDRINFPLTLELGTRLNQYCLNTDSIAEGDWLTTTSRHLDKTVASVSFYVAHQRFSDPKIALLTLADSQTDDKHDKETTTCCVIRLYESKLNEFIAMYNKKNWMDEEGNTISQLCVITRIRVAVTLDMIENGGKVLVHFINTCKY